LNLRVFLLLEGADLFIPLTDWSSRGACLIGESGRLGSRRDLLQGTGSLEGELVSVYIYMYVCIYTYMYIYVYIIHM
jgi:hypothetical protein